MNSLERVLAAATFQGPDRPPVFLVLLQQGAIEMGLPLSDYYSHGDHIAEGQTRLIEKYGHDCVVGVPHIVEDTLPFGTELKYYDAGPPSVTGMSIKRYEQIPELKVPRAADHPQMRETLSAIRKLANRFKGEVPIIGAAIAPFSLPSMIMGTKHFIHLMKDETGLRDKYWQTLLNKCVEYVTQWANDQLEAGADIIVLADGMASADLLTPQEFQTDALPVLKETLSKINGFVAYEFVGKAEALLPYCKDLPVVAFLVGSDDNLTVSKGNVGGSKALVGNVNNIKLTHWDRDRVYYECRKALHSMRNRSGGFILANQGPEIPYHTSEENIRAFMEAVHDFEMN
ncbi:MAG: uroporphyrinogen decarboxylase family protein [Candidatus Omnitrophica bacterium]|nr:uroporphyrinogen decarboxylase family protein [Candidatus Omnitrophota bacterium]MCA9429027.1 uroporphyrinogen decarboxylase family protein [Candidatus Omnitrophota bacterium]MCA9436471.1 uroporphyrinogen decarboxylase family protein [Candidatus Omnitrophota bacterium]MCA9447171.1 uroporphyrinogen decarboxylase family protein [Candidatus Omnitrophota bacterium]